MALSITDLKKGTVFEFENIPYKVVEYSQKVMGRGGSIVNVRIKSLIDGRVLAKTFKGSEQLKDADITRRDVNYLYADNQSYYFMDLSDYTQIELSVNDVEDKGKYLKEGDKVQIQFFNDSPIALELPNKLPLKVTYTENVVKGDTTSNITKEAQLETGLTIRVPAFIKVGDVVRVDTRTGDYIERDK
jgi:elongation factor P